MQDKVFIPLTFAWSGSFAAAAMDGVGVWISVASGCVALFASVYAIRASRATIRLRQLESNRAIDVICDSCKSGKPPVACPYGEHNKPEHCLKEKP